MKASEPFIDEAEIHVVAGGGGNGIVAFRREKFVPRGGPSGGDGGRGGHVILIADRNLATLRDYRYQRRVRATRGGDGGGNRKTGAQGEDAIVRVPVGTVVYDLDAGEEAPPLVDLSRPGDRLVVARGGRGGRGNAHFTTSTRQTPDFATEGRPGEVRRLRLSLKLLADVGLVGLPNAGKSTLLRRISAARPRVADYPFTTLTPHLGVAEVDERRLVVADIPGLIEGASEGIGLGDRFLRHVERTRVLVHLVDSGALLQQERDLLGEYAVVRRELEAYGAGLEARRELVALSKIDLLGERTVLDAVEAALRERGCEVFRISAVSGEGILELLRAMVRAVDEESPDV